MESFLWRQQYDLNSSYQQLDKNVEKLCWLIYWNFYREILYLVRLLIGTVLVKANVYDEWKLVCTYLLTFSIVVPCEVCIKIKNIIATVCYYRAIFSVNYWKISCKFAHFQPLSKLAVTSLNEQFTNKDILQKKLKSILTFILYFLLFKLLPKTMTVPNFPSYIKH